MRKLITSGLLLALAVGVGVAGAKPAGVNGQITFARFNPNLGDTQVYIVNPDGRRLSGSRGHHASRGGGPASRHPHRA